MSYTTPDYIHDPLYVVTPIFNPVRFKSRWKHYERFAKMVKDAGAILITVEAAYGHRHHALQEGETEHLEKIHQIAPTKPAEYHKARSEERHQYIRVRTNTELWIKESLINIGVSRLPEDWKYVAWIDADVAFARPNWVGETIHQLQHYKVVQMFNQSVDLGPRYAILNNARAFMHCHVKGVPRPEGGRNRGGYYGPQQPEGPMMWHPGFSWAMTREAWDGVGGLIDFAMMGAADNHMAHALIGEVDDSYHPDVHPTYKRKLQEWQELADRHIRRNVGYVSGLLLHYWHGKKVDRRYWDRWKVIVDNKFNPDTDLKYDWQGLIQLVDDGTPRMLKLRDDSQHYMRARNEDSIDLDGISDET